MLFRRRKKEEPHSEDIYLARGIYLKQPVMDNGHVIFNCFLRCLIVFFLVFGSLGGFLSSFSISYNYVLVIISYLLLSMYFSFLYSTSKLIYRDVGYILFFILFVMAILRLRIYANSGFYAIINTILKQAQTFFDLSGVREYETQITNDYLTVAIVAVFIGMVLIIILNIWLYSTMSIFWTILLTFPLLMIPLYMKLNPDLLYVVSLATGYFAVVIFKANGHYHVFAWEKIFRVEGWKKDRIAYTQDGGICKQILLTALLVCLSMVVIVQTVLPAGDFQSKFGKDRFRDKTSDMIGNFILLGFVGMYNHYPSNGGLSSGELGGVSSVRPDYQPDLLVSFAPYSNEAIYLKGFTGVEYGENCWYPIYISDKLLEEKNDVEIFKEESMNEEMQQLFDKYMNGELYSGFGTMDVKNVGADISYMYYPYYTWFSDYSQFRNHGIMSNSQGLGLNEQAKYRFFPKVVWEESLGNIKVSQIDESLVNEVYFEVPEKNKEVIANECEKIGLHKDMTENEIVQTVRNYFQDNIPYTLKPGATPKDEDFVNYFLTKNRKGYCAHFATTATLLFRQMGIPARYIEGYAFNLEAVLASTENTDKTYTDYYQGYSTIGKSTVMDVEVTDAMAHAWVEIYVPDFGWKVVEVTPGSNEAADEDDFWAAFNRLLNGADKGNLPDANGFGDLELSQYVWLVYVVLAGMGGFVVLSGIRMSVRKMKRYRKCHDKNQKEALIGCYADLCDQIRVCDLEFNGCRSHREQIEYMQRKFDVIADISRYSSLLECISYSKYDVLEEERQMLLQFIKQVQKAVWKQASLREKIWLIKR